MATLTRLKFGPKDHGRRVSWDNFEAADYEPGWRYEYIAGRIEVSPQANPPQDELNVWIYAALLFYWKSHERLVHYVSMKPRVFVPDVEEVTCPEPDAALYFEYPVDVPVEERRWQMISPALVVEVASPETPAKDYKRNVELYRQVPSIREYWIVDRRPKTDQVIFTVYRRGRGLRWKKPVVVPFGETFTTDLLPGFELAIDPSRR